MSDELELTIEGYQGVAVPNTFLHQEESTDHLALILPGLGYTCQMPLLYYATEVLLGLSADVLLVEYDYREIWHDDAISQEARQAHVFADVSAAAEAALDQRRAYARLTLVGKSLGTVAMTHLLTSDLPLRPQACLYLTPIPQSMLQNAAAIRVCPRTLIVAGTADRFYDPHLLEQVVEATQAEILLVEGANHSLAFPGDPLRSIQALERAINAIQRFVAS